MLSIYPLIVKNPDLYTREITRSVLSDIQSECNPKDILVITESALFKDELLSNSYLENLPFGLFEDFLVLAKNSSCNLTNRSSRPVTVVSASILATGVNLVKAGYKTIYFVVPRRWEQLFKQGELTNSYLNKGHNSLFQLMHRLEIRHGYQFDHSFDLNFVCSDPELYSHIKKYVRSEGFKEGLI